MLVCYSHHLMYPPLPLQDLKNPPTGTGTDQGEATAGSWQWFALMHEAIGSRPSITPPVLIASCTGEDEIATASCLPVLPKIVCVGGMTTEASTPSQTPSPQPQPGRSEGQRDTSSPPAKRARTDPVLQAVLEDREREEARYSRLEAQNDQIIKLFEKMVDKM